jgi:hypothetical protein
MDERLRFVARLLEGEKMAPLCAEFGISRKTGYKIFDRYKDCGLEAFSDRSRRPYRQANRVPAPIEATIVRLKREYPGWGAPKIREKLRPHIASVQLPAISTVHARSARVYRGLDEVSYPFADATFTVTHCGRICFHGRKINLSHVFAGQNVGVTQVGERIWLVTFMHYDVGYFDDEASGADCGSLRLESVTYVLGINRHPCDRKIPRENGSSGWIRTSNPPVNSLFALIQHRLVLSDLHQ